MQNRYAGDLGDYAKCGLLRRLCGDDLRLGMVWYLTDDESHNADGRHRPSEAVRPCDPELYSAFREMGDRRSVASLQDLAIWPRGTRFVDEPLIWRSIARRTERGVFRSAWVQRALRATRGCDVICADPDNGLEVLSVRATAAIGPKYATLEEMCRFWRRGQSLVVYQHATRRGTIDEQAARRAAQLQLRLRGAAIRALRFRRGSGRLFLIAMQPNHRSRIERRIDTMLTGAWVGHFQRVDLASRAGR